MFKRNIDFFAVALIAIVMLGFTELRSWSWPAAIDSFRVENAIDIRICPTTRQVIANLAAAFR